MKGFALYLPAGMDFAWKSVREYLAHYESLGVALNVAQLIGHGTLRVAAMGFARRPPTAGEQATMERMMDEAMADGAYGLATGLIYAPGSYADTPEIDRPDVALYLLNYKREMLAMMGRIMIVRTTIAVKTFEP